MAEDLTPHGSNPPGPNPPGQSAPGQSAPGPDSSGRVPSEEDRDRYMRLLDRALERGLLGDGDYMLRADALQQAGDIEQMNMIVQQLPVLETPAKPRQTRSGGRRGRLAASPVQSQLPVQPHLPERMPDQTPGELREPFFDPDDLTGLDPVDVAMLMRSKQVRKAPSANRRIGAIAVVVLLFLVLVVLGLYLASHDHAVNGSNGLAPPHHLIFASNSRSSEF